MMKKALPLVLVATWTLSLLEGSPTPAAVQGDEVSLKTIEPFAYFCMPFRGSYAQIQEGIGKLMLEMQSQNAMPTGALMGIYYNSPEQVDSRDLEWEIGFPVSPRQAVQPPLVLKEWKYPQAAVSMHKGPYAEISKTIVRISEWMTANGFAPAGPVLERYLDMNPAEMRPEDLRTEVWIPCQKK